MISSITSLVSNNILGRSHRRVTMTRVPESLEPDFRIIQFVRLRFKDAISLVYSGHLLILTGQAFTVSGDTTYFLGSYAYVGYRGKERVQIKNIKLQDTEVSKLRVETSVDLLTQEEKEKN